MFIAQNLKEFLFHVTANYNYQYFKFDSFVSTLMLVICREAIVKVCTAAKCLKQEMKRPKGIKQINKILTRKL